MKRLLTGALALILSLAAQATTLNPIQLLNPAGSTSGQAIVSTGASTAPAWANVSAAALTGLVPIANGGTNAATASAALTNLGAAPLASPTFTGTVTIPTATISGGTMGAVTINNSSIGTTTPAVGKFSTLQATSTITPSSTAGIVGTTTNDNAQAGSVGEFPTPTNLTGVSLTSGTTANTSSVSLTAGDWDVQCTNAFSPAGGTTDQSQITGVSTTSATLGAGGSFQSMAFTAAVGVGSAIASPAVRISIASTTTVFCVANSTFSGSTQTVAGFLHPRRVR